MTNALRLQLACLILIGYILINYYTAKRRKTQVHIVFSLLIVISLANVIFDFLFVWLFTKFGILSDALNRAYLISLCLVFYLIVLYWTSIIRTNHERTPRKLEIIYGIPVLIVTVMILVTPITYTDIGGWYYAMGPSIIAMYISITINLLICILLLIRNWNTINNKNRIAYIVLWSFDSAVMFSQLLDRYNIITSGAVTLFVLSIYMFVENPDLLLIEQLKYEKDRANTANNSKSSFIAHVSHEIRTPINAILGMNEMILRESKEDNVIHYANDISTAAYSLYGIINSVLDMSKMESGKMEIYPVKYNVEQLIHDTLAAYNSRIRAKNLELFVEVNPSIPKELIGDDVRISQILSNLISNAIKYTPEGFIKFSVDGNFDGDTINLTFAVKDTGIGIKEEDVSKLFVAFERIEESRNRNIEGAGIGMNITNNLLKMMGSKLKVESVYGQGSEFSFTITQRIVSMEPLGEAANRLSNDNDDDDGVGFVAPKARILVVDDNELNRRVFTSLLKETGINIDEAENGRECLKKVIKEPYDIIFMDHMMPEMDGVETMLKMKEMDMNINRDTPVVMLTANAIGSIQDIYRQAGFSAYLSKPIFAKSLERMIRSFLDPSKVINKDNRIKIAASLGEDWKNQLPTVRGIDWNEAVKHLPSEEVLKATVKEFQKSIRSEAQAMDALYVDLNSGNNLEEFRIKVHALRGAASIIGAEMLSFGANEIEEAAKTGNIELIREKYPFMINYYRTFEDRLQMFNDGDDEKLETIDFPQVIALVQMVLLEMEEMNTAEALDSLDEIERYQYPNAIQQSINDMRAAVEQYDMDTLQTVNEKLLDELRLYRNVQGV